MGPELTDAELIERSLRDPEAFAAVFDRHYSAIYVYFAGRVGATQAEELAQETLAQAFASRHRFDLSRDSARPWLFGIASNILRNHARAERRQLRAYRRFGIETPGLDEAADVAERLDASSAIVAIATGLRDLDADQRDALLLLAWAGLAYEEIAEALAIPIGTVRSRIFRARYKLRELLRDRGQLPDERLAPEEANDG